jgi:hypothetical protein
MPIPVDDSSRQVLLTRVVALALVVCSVFWSAALRRPTEQVRDTWWADIPASEADGMTRLCRESGKPVFSFLKVRASQRSAAEKRLQDVAVAPIDAEEATRIAGGPPDKGRWDHPYLVRSLSCESSDSGFTVYWCGANLLVGYTAVPGSDGKIVRRPLVVDLDSTPVRVFVTCGVGIR